MTVLHLTFEELVCFFFVSTRELCEFSLGRIFSMRVLRLELKTLFIVKSKDLKTTALPKRNKENKFGSTAETWLNRENRLQVV